LYFEDKPILVIDAKSPSENIEADAHVQQAYSYAIHPDVRCREFALCNGRHIAFYDIYRREPLAIVRYEDFEKEWGTLEKHMLPKYLLQPSLRCFAPDFGLALHRLGMRDAAEIYMLESRLNLFARVDDSTFTASANVEHAGTPHMVSFDFESRMLPSVLSGLPTELSTQFRSAMFRAPFQASAGLAIELDLRCRLGSLIDVEDEQFAPLIVEEVLGSRFVPDPGIELPSDVPAKVFKLREAYRISPLSGETPSAEPEK